jgi:hypothetical protein
VRVPQFCGIGMDSRVAPRLALTAGVAGIFIGPFRKKRKVVFGGGRDDGMGFSPWYGLLAGIRPHGSIGCRDWVDSASSDQHTIAMPTRK